MNESQWIGHESESQTGQGGPSAYPDLSSVFAPSLSQMAGPRGDVDTYLIMANAARALRLLLPEATIEIVASDDLWRIRVDEFDFEAIVLEALLRMSAAAGREPVILEARNLLLGGGVADSHVPSASTIVISVRVGNAAQPLARSATAHIAAPLQTAEVARHSGGIVVVTELDPAEGIRIYVPRNCIMPGERGAEPAQMGPTILIVDDDDLVRQNTALALTRQGYQVLEATDGLHALGVLKTAKRIDLLITDIIMPGGIDGRQLVRAVRKARSEMPVLFTSGFISDDDLSTDESVMLLEKPFRPEELRTKVRAALAQADL